MDRPVRQRIAQRFRPLPLSERWCQRVRCGNAVVLRDVREFRELGIGIDHSVGSVNHVARRIRMYIFALKRRVVTVFEPDGVLRVEPRHSDGLTGQLHRLFRKHLAPVHAEAALTNERTSRLDGAVDGGEGRLLYDGAHGSFRAHGAIDEFLRRHPNRGHAVARTIGIVIAVGVVGRIDAGNWRREYTNIANASLLNAAAGRIKELRAQIVEKGLSLRVRRAVRIGIGNPDVGMIRIGPKETVRAGGFEGNVA